MGGDNHAGCCGRGGRGFWQSPMLSYDTSPEARLGAAVYLVSAFWGLAVSLVAVTIGFTWASVPGWGGGLGCGFEGGVVVALMKRPPRTTWFHTSPRSICSADGPARWALWAAGWPLVKLFRLRSGACFAKPPSLPSTSHSHGSSLCGFPPGHSTEAVPAG